MKKHGAFSLIELSIVILIIGILIAGVTQSSRLVSAMRLASAQSLTQSSPVSSINDLEIWLETTMDSSFGGSQPDEGGIANWHDINPQSTDKYIANQNTIDNQPKYTNNSINNLPAISFEGNDDMQIPNLNAGSNTSYFFVIKPTNKETAGIFDSAPANGYVFRNFCNSGCPEDGQFEWWLIPGDMPATPLGLSPNQPTIIYVNTTLTPSSSPTKTISYFRNGTFISSASNNSDTNPTAWVNPRIGSINFNDAFYNGKIGEIIIFSRVLKNEERDSVTKYLGKKWGIKTTSN